MGFFKDMFKKWSYDDTYMFKKFTMHVTFLFIILFINLIFSCMYYIYLWHYILRLLRKCFLFEMNFEFNEPGTEKLFGSHPKIYIKPKNVKFLWGSCFNPERFHFTESKSRCYMNWFEILVTWIYNIKKRSKYLVETMKNVPNIA